MGRRLAGPIDPRINGRRVVVIGASAGGIRAVCALLAGLPGDFTPPIFVVIHTGPEQSVLPDVLRRCGALPAVHPRDKEPIRNGCIYVAPPDTHMRITDGRIELSRGPLENRTRPAIDPLFRSAARSYRDRAIGIILSGELDDGTAGLFAIKARGGVAMVQDPDDASSPSMPRNALNAVAVDHCLPVAKMAPVLVKLSQEKTTRGTAGRKPQDQPTPALPKRMAARELGGMAGRQVALSCPDCAGPLFEVGAGQAQYHCLVGHTFSPLNLDAAHTDALERALWIAMRTLRERLTVQRVLADRHTPVQNGKRTQRMEEETHAIEREIALLKEIQQRI